MDIHPARRSDGPLAEVAADTPQGKLVNFQLVATGDDKFMVYSFSRILRHTGKGDRWVAPQTFDAPGAVSLDTQWTVPRRMRSRLH